MCRSTTSCRQLKAWVRLQEESSSSEEESVLQVGGIRLIVSRSGDVLRAQQAAGRRCRRNKRIPQRKRCYKSRLAHIYAEWNDKTHSLHAP